MSIVIKSDELNVLIYKYLQQCNLSHTAYTLFNQASLEQSLSQFKFDVKSGQLISLIEKALIFSQIQSHITINDYQECKEPFCLLKSHVCKITQKAKQEKEILLQQLNQKVFATMRRTSSVHNTLQPNRDFQQIIYQQRSANYFDKIPLRIPDFDTLTLKISRGDSVAEKFYCAYDSDTYTMTIMTKKDHFLNAVGIVPCRQQVKIFEVIDDLLICLYEGNYCDVIQLTNSGPGEVLCFKLSLIGQCKSIKVNRKLKNLVAFQTQDQYCIINLNKKAQISAGIGKFEWIGVFDYLLLQPKNKTVRRCSLKPDSNNSIQQFSCPLNNPTKVKVSMSEIYFSVESLSENVALVYNFDQSEPLYIFDFKDNQSINGLAESSDEAEQGEKLRQVLWVTANSTDNFILVTDLSIKTFEIELNNFLKVIQISQYDAELKQVGVIKKSEDQMYLVGLGVENFLCYDVDLGKIERVQYTEGSQSRQLLQLNQNYILGLLMDNTLSLIESSDLEPLFL